MGIEFSNHYVIINVIIHFYCRGIDHQKFDITNIKSVNTKVNPNIGGKNSNGGINSAQISLPRAKNGGNRPSLISRVEAKYQPHNGQRGNQPKGQGTRDIAKDPCIGGSSNVGTSRFKRGVFCKYIEYFLPKII